ncbi:MAG: tetratricopeptide repeat protein [Marinobacter sp.]|nr:tetratricopeptide repeat protein [Marinobacter sp.]
MVQLILCLLAVAGASSAEPAPIGQEAMSAGIEQFRQGNYHAAQEQFETAQALGVDSPALHYNLGVIYFKTGNYQAAEARFSILLDGPDQALAQYNLGLVALADNRVGDAERWFSRAATPGAPDTVRELAKRQLAAFEPAETPSHQSTHTVTQGYLSAGIGYDSNMASVPDDSPSNRGSVFADLVVAGTLSRTFNPEWRIVWDGVLYGQDYAQGSHYDSSILQSRVAGIRSYDPMDVGLRASASRAWLASDELETRFGLTLFARSDNCLLAGSVQSCYLGFTAEQVEGGPDYAAYTGQWYQFEARGEQVLNSLFTDVFYRWESNDRNDFKDGDLFISLSPMVHTLGAEVLYPWRSDLAIGAEAALRYARYGQRNRRVDDGELTERLREDVRLDVGVMAEFYLSSRWLVRNQWLFRNQNSRIERYDYTRHTYTLSLEGVF